MVEWLAGNRIRGTSTERTTTTGFNPVAGVVGGWKEVGRTTLGSAGSTISVSSLADKRYYMLLSDFQSPSGGELPYFRAGNGSFDTGSNYAMRYSADGASDPTPTVSNSNAHFRGAGMGTNDHFDICYLANLSGEEKLGQWWNVGRNTAGAGTAPIRDEGVFKHAFTSNPYDQIQRLSLSAETYATGSEVVVLGWDPADTHATNFWEELASVDLSGGSADILDSGTITAKKYLWVQYYIEPSAGVATTCLCTFNSDTTSTYARRRSADGGSDATVTSQSNLDMRTGNTDRPYFANMFIINNSANEKLVINNIVGESVAAASNAPDRAEIVGKWANTSAQITKITLTNDQGSVDFGTNSIMKVWGSN